MRAGDAARPYLLLAGRRTRSSSYLVHALVLVAAVALLSSALMESDREHRSESILDGLTGMLLRRSLTARMAELTEQSHLAGASIGLTWDIDNFKAVNDEHGHTVGNAVLIDVAYAPRQELRASDVAYRLGGEEFLVLLPGAGPGEAAERLRKAVGAFPAGGVNVTMPLGVASSRGGGFDYRALFGAADDALYEAKATGRSRVITAGTGTSRRYPPRSRCRDRARARWPTTAT